MLKKLFRRPAIRMGLVDHARIKRTRIRNAGFVSFLSETGGVRPRNTDAYDARLRRRKLAKNIVIAALSAGGLWVVIESAHAFTLF